MRIILVVSIMCMLISCSTKEQEAELCRGFSVEEGTMFEREDYELINLVLSGYAFRHGPRHIVQAVDTSITSVIAWRLESENIDFDSTALENLSLRNDSLYLLSPDLLINSEYLLSNQELSCIADDPDKIWDNYYRKYPNVYGLLYFSRPGYSDDGRKAILQYKWFGGYMFAEGFAVQFEKIEGQWQIVSHFMLWVS